MPVDSGQHWAALCLLALSEQPDVTEDSEIYSHMHWNLMSLPETGESGHGI